MVLLPAINLITISNITYANELGLDLCKFIWYPEEATELNSPLYFTRF